MHSPEPYLAASSSSCSASSSRAPSHAGHLSSGNARGWSATLELPLAGFAKRYFDFCLGGACYPEKHVDSPSADADLAHLRFKVEAGCEYLITQLFFDNQRYFDFVARVRAAGIGVPIIPGIMPITNFEQVQRFTQMCGASIPETLLEELQRLKDRPEAVLSLGVAHAAAQCLDLLQRGAPGIHFYTLNRSAATRTILTALRTIWPPARYPA